MCGENRMHTFSGQLLNYRKLRYCERWTRGMGVARSNDAFTQSGGERRPKF
jgi:hypothetical protein